MAPTPAGTNIVALMRTWTTSGTQAYLHGLSVETASRPLTDDEKAWSFCIPALDTDRRVGGRMLNQLLVPD
jgi:hypothetical protein